MSEYLVGTTLQAIASRRGRGREKIAAIADERVSIWHWHWVLGRWCWLDDDTLAFNPSVNCPLWWGDNHTRCNGTLPRLRCTQHSICIPPPPVAHFHFHFNITISLHLTHFVDRYIDTSLCTLLWSIVSFAYNGIVCVRIYIVRSTPSKWRSLDVDYAVFDCDRWVF